MPTLTRGPFIVNKAIFYPVIKYPWADSLIINSMDALVPVLPENRCAEKVIFEGKGKCISEGKRITSRLNHYINVMFLRLLLSRDMSRKFHRPKTNEKCKTSNKN